MNFSVKRKNLFLLDDISPYKNFINARKTLENKYMKSKKNEKIIKTTAITIRSNNFNNNPQIKTKKISSINSYSKKLLKEQKHIISHIFKDNESKNENYVYHNNNSLLKTLDRLNYIRYKNDKNNLITKYSQKNIFKTIPKIGYKSERKRKINYEDMNLPVIKYIYRKKTKLKNIL